MDTPTIAEYYRESDPLKRKKLLDQAIESGEDAEANAVRKEIWEARYSGKSETGGPADGYLRLWMVMEFNRNNGNRMFGGNRRARKEIMKEINSVRLMELKGKSALHEELLYREFCQMVQLYMNLCVTDRNYNTVLCGLIKIKEDSAKAKIKNDIYETSVKLPKDMELTEELGLLTKAAREMYELQFPGEGGMPE